jgi:hypothetical protein
MEVLDTVVHIENNTLNLKLNYLTIEQNKRKAKDEKNYTKRH